jgi:putative oxidoreductase
MKKLFGIILSSPERSPAPLLLIRGVAGFVFLLEGILKFVTPDKLGVGRFVKIGIPSPEVLAPFVGVVEIACGLLIVFGLLTRLAALPLIIDMLVAIATTKVPILLHSGFWDMAHEARLDFAMLACSCVLLTVGAGDHSIDAWLRGRLGTRSSAAKGSQARSRSALVPVKTS